MSSADNLPNLANVEALQPQEETVLYFPPAFDKSEGCSIYVNPMWNSDTCVWDAEEEILGRGTLRFPLGTKIAVSISMYCDENYDFLAYWHGSIAGFSSCGSAITDTDLAHLSLFNQLQNLELSGCRRLTGSGLAHLHALIDLKILYLDGCTGLTDDSLKHLRHLNQLQYLNLQACSQLTDAGLMHLRSLAQIREIELDCTGLTDIGLTYLRDLVELKQLNFSHNTYKPCRITNVGIATLRDALPMAQIRHSRIIP